jgi:hypothetical protein
MRLATGARTLAVVGLLGVASLALPAGQANALPEHRPGTQTCSYWNPQVGGFVYFSQDQFIVVKDANGNDVVLFCGADGHWHLHPDPALTTGAPSAPVTTTSIGVH